MTLMNSSCFRLWIMTLPGRPEITKLFFDTNENITYQWLKTPLVRNGISGWLRGCRLFAEVREMPKTASDNDRDGLVDESQFDGIDNDGDWRAWEDVNGNGVFDIGD